MWPSNLNKNATEIYSTLKKYQRDSNKTLKLTETLNWESKKKVDDGEITDLHEATSLGVAPTEKPLFWANSREAYFQHQNYPIRQRRR